MITLAAAALLLLQIPPGAAVTPFEGAAYFEADGTAVGIVVVTEREAAAMLDGRAPERTLLGYPAALIEEADGDGATRERLMLDFGADWVVISATRRDGAEGSIAGGTAPETEPGSSPLAVVREILRPGPEAGSYPGSVALWVDGYLVDDAAGHVPLGFFEGPLVLEVRAAE